MSLIVLVAVVLGAVAAVEVVQGRSRGPTGRASDAARGPGPPDAGSASPGAEAAPPGSSAPSDRAQLGPANRVLMLLGLCVLAVSLALPFARNEAGCLDHCYDARQWFWWVPTHNLGGLLLLIGVVGAASRLRSMPARRPHVRPWAVCGWAGATFTVLVAPAMVDDFLYGGPSPEILPTLWVAPAGWVLLWVGSTQLPLVVRRIARGEVTWRRPDVRLLPGAVVTALVLAAVVLTAVVSDGEDDRPRVDIGHGWERTEAEPGAVAVSGADGGQTGAVMRQEPGDDGPFEITSDLVRPSQGQRTVLEGSDAAAARPLAVAAARDGGLPGWLVVGGDGQASSPLTVWSDHDTPPRAQNGLLPQAPAVTLPDSQLGTTTVAVATAGEHQMVAASDEQGGRIVVWARYDDGPWERSSLDPLASARSTPLPEPGPVDALRVAHDHDGDRIVLAAIAGDPAILSLWASEPLPDERPVSRWEGTADEVDGKPACTLNALHAGTDGVLLGWSPHGPAGCRAQDQLRFALLDGGVVVDLPTLNPQASDALVVDAVTLDDGTTIAVGSRDDPPHSATGSNERAPALWIRPADEGWEPRPVDDRALSNQLDQVATTITTAPSRSQVDTTEQLLIVTRPQEAAATPGDGLDLWSWEPPVDGDGG